MSFVSILKGSFEAAKGAGRRARCGSVAGVREDMTRRLSEAGKPVPTQAQFSMILAESPLVRVVAGAGSGKSTTLVLRCVYLHFYQGVPWDEITVVTFTRASRQDFIEKLGAAVRIWGEALDKKALSHVVRTFHSLAFSQAAAAGIQTQTIDQPEVGSRLDAAHVADLPFPPLGIPEDGELAQMLNDVACRLMRDDERFRECVMGLYNASFIAASITRDEDRARDARIAAVRAHDQDRTAWMENLWRREIAPELMRDSPIRFKLASFTTQGRSAAGPANGPWCANAYVPELGAWLLLGASQSVARGRVMPDGFSLGAAVGAKKSCVNVLSSTAPIIWVNSPEDLLRLHVRLRWSPEKASEFPKFSVRLSGDLSPVPLLAAFWQQAQFIQSLGLGVEFSATKAVAAVSGVDALFARALGRFWPAFVRALGRVGVSTSMAVFEQLANEAALEDVPLAALSGCTNLLVDEFQDISGNIVKWLVAVRRVLCRQGQIGSLMVVGDDWQSIYGWRGASPRFFTRFVDYFAPEEGEEVQTITLGENFRSSQRIVDAGAAMISFVREKLPKDGLAAGPNAQIEDQVKLGLYKASDLFKNDGEPFFPPGSSAFVIGRLNTSISGRAWGGARALTIHSSKGLEADYVLMVDDFAPPTRHPLRSSWYALAGLGDYDQAQRDETHRLAYVAITRAKKGCIWVVPEQAAGGMFGVLAHAESKAVQSGAEIG